MPRLGELIQQAREEAHMLQKDLAAHLGVSVKTLSRWERGEHDPSRAKLSAIARATGKPLAFFTGEADAAEPPAQPHAPRLASEPGIDALLRDIELCAREGIVGRYALLLANQDFGGLCRDKEQALRFARAYLAAVRDLEQRAAEPPAVEDEQ